MALESLIEKIKDLPDYVLRKISSIVDTYEQETKEEVKVEFEICPKCGIAHPRVIKAGKAGSGKQMYRCMHCNKRFTYDNGGLTFYSHQSPEQWNDFIELQLKGGTVDELAGKIGVTHATAFSMRHKLLHALEKNEDLIVVSDLVEIDEKYLLKSHKGESIEGIKPKKRGRKAKKRGISTDQICILTAVQRGGESFLRSYNMGKPSSNEVMNLEGHIEKGSYIWTDDLNSYNKLEKELFLKRKIVSSKEEYDKVNHLNNVNNFHSKIEEWYSKMKGVATKYINRYSALFNMRRITAKMDPREGMHHVRARLTLRGGKYMKISEIKENNIFCPSDLGWRG